MITVDELMTPHPITLGPKATLDEAAKLMKTHRIRHIPVVNRSGHLTGLLTQRDLMAASRAEDICTVREVMRRKLFTTTPETSLRAAALIMEKHKIGSLPVLAGQNLVGIITDSDYVALSITLLEQMEDDETDLLDDREAGLEDFNFEMPED